MVFGSTALLASLLTLVLPETYHKPLPDTVEEAEHPKRAMMQRNQRIITAPTQEGKMAMLMVDTGLDGDRPASSSGGAGSSVKDDIYQGGRSSTESDELHFDEDSSPAAVKSILKKTDLARYAFNNTVSTDSPDRQMLTSLLSLPFKEKWRMLWTFSVE
jgi:hypothetical protein